jgi:hypothetical protein
MSAAAPRPDPDEVDSEQLLAQGDELLRASRRLLDDLDGRIDLTEKPPTKSDADAKR